MVIWFTGLSSAGKTTLAEAVEMQLCRRGLAVQVLDGDQMRRSLCRDLGFSNEDRIENIRRIGVVASLLERNGIIVLAAAISPFRHARDEVRKLCDAFLEVYVNTPIHVCEKRDQKGLYAKARRGEIANVTGIDSPYEPPLQPEVECLTDQEDIADCVNKVLRAIQDRFPFALDNGEREL
jgi:adenylylsulfate kinase